MIASYYLDLFILHMQDICGRGQSELFGEFFFADGGCLHMVQKGNLRIEIHFAEALTQTVNVIVYAEFEAVLEIDKGRNIIYNHP